MRFETKIIKFGNSYGFTIPTKISKFIGFNINDEIIISLTEKNTIEIKKK